MPPASTRRPRDAAPRLISPGPPPGRLFGELTGVQGQPERAHRTRSAAVFGACTNHYECEAACTR